MDSRLGAFPKAALLIWFLLLRCMPLGVDTWSHLLIVLPNSMLIISSAPPMMLTLYWLLPSIPYLMFMPWGQEASPSKCVLLSTSKAARRRMTAWRNMNEGCFLGC